jgi:hypothetical protein
MKRMAALLIVAGVLILSTKAFGMFEVCLFSPVKGKVVLKGQPVVGAVIERSYDWAWKNQKGRDETKTDQNGEFSFPAIYGTMILGSVLPHEPSINQEILIKVDGKSYGAWYAFKREYAEYGELGGALNGQPIDLLCDLEKKVTNHGEYGGIGELRTAPKQP